MKLEKYLRALRFRVYALHAAGMISASQGSVILTCGGKRFKRLRMGLPVSRLESPRRARLKEVA